MLSGLLVSVCYALHDGVQLMEAADDCINARVPGPGVRWCITPQVWFRMVSALCQPAMPSSQPSPPISSLPTPQINAELRLLLNRMLEKDVLLRITGPEVRDFGWLTGKENIIRKVLLPPPLPLSAPLPNPRLTTPWAVVVTH